MCLRESISGKGKAEKLATVSRVWNPSTWEGQDNPEFIPNNTASSSLAWATWDPITKTKQAKKERWKAAVSWHFTLTRQLEPSTLPRSHGYCKCGSRHNWVCTVSFSAYLCATESPNPSPDGSTQHFPKLLFMRFVHSFHYQRPNLHTWRNDTQLCHKYSGAFPIWSGWSSPCTSRSHLLCW